MPSDDYAAVGGGGALRLKGAKVSKKKKKDKKKKSDLEKNLTGNDEQNKEDSDGTERKAEDAEDVKVEVRKTESELRYEEARKKRVRVNLPPISSQRKANKREASRHGKSARRPSRTTQNA